MPRLAPLDLDKLTPEQKQAAAWTGNDGVGNLLLFGGELGEVERGQTRHETMSSSYRGQPASPTAFLSALSKMWLMIASPANWDLSACVVQDPLAVQSTLPPSRE